MEPLLHKGIFGKNKIKETPDPAATQRKSLDNKCSHISNPDKTEKGAKAVFSQSKPNKETVEAFYHLYSQAAVTAYFLKRQEPSANILITHETKDEKKNGGIERTDNFNIMRY